MIARGEYVAPGVQPPERFGGVAAVYEKLLAELRARGVGFREEIQELPAA
jgi:hypothetical protein